MLPKTPFAIDVRAADKFLKRKTVAYAEAIGPAFVEFPKLPGGMREKPGVGVIPFLGGIQGNMLQAHGRTFVSLMFFRFKNATVADRESNGRFLASVADKVTSALQQYSDARHQVSDLGKKSFVSLMLTAAGVKATDRPMPQESRGDDAFAQGMLTRHELLGDPSKEGRPSTWQSVYQRETDLHGMWLVAHRTEAGLRAQCDRLIKLGRGSVRIVHRERGVNMRDSEGFTREPFGFRDGLSMPAYFLPTRQTGGLNNPPLDRLLIDSDGMPEHGGAFMVYRKLEQDVAAFRRFEKKLGPLLRMAHLPAQDAGRVLIGRKRNGVPLVEDPPRPGPGHKINNHFTFADDMAGARCPFHAHIRKANFRQPQVPNATPPERQLQGQFVRRGATYGRGPRWNPRAVKQPTGGLQFMAYMSNISGQFETMQATWFGRGDFPTRETGQLDPILMGAEPKANGQWSWPQVGIPPVDLPRLVTPRGGAYFFVPSIQWLTLLPGIPPLTATEA